MTNDLPARSTVRASLALFLAACFAACGGSSTPPAPAAPLAVTATPADGSVLVSWEASPGATGYRVYYNAASAGPVSVATSMAVDAGTALFISVTGLVDGTEYQFAVAARGLTGEGALSAEVTATPMVNAPIAVASTTPADSAAAVSRTTPIAVTFNRAALTTSITGQTMSGACSGSVQLSSDNFNTCRAFTGAPAASNANQTFTFSLATPLTPGTTYLLRVTTAAADANGIALAQAFTLAHGFSTANALTVTSISPADGATLVPLNTKVTVAFSAPITASTATGNTADTSCSGSLQLSTNNFTTCLTLATVTASAQSVVLAPASPFPPGALVQTRITTALLDANGNPLSTTDTSAGFTTVPPLTVAQVNPDGAGSTSVDFLPTLQVAFAAPAAAASITANVGASTACSGSIQLSKASDDFAANTCVPMAAPPATTDGGTTFTVTPAALLASSTKYLIRVTTAATDMSGTPLAATYTSSGFTTRAFAVVSISPADGASNLSRKQVFTITFNRPVNSSSLGNGTCADPINLIEAGTGTCAPHSAETASGATVTLTPAPYLDASASYQLTISSQTLLDDSGGKLATSDSTTIGYTTQPGATPTLTPANGASNVVLNTTLQLSFNVAVDPTTVTVATAATPSCGTVSLTKSATCVQFTGQPTTIDNKTFTLTPAAPLVANATYTFASSASVLDATEVPAAAASATFTTGSATDTTPPHEVSNVQATAALQSINVSWVNPSDSDFRLVRIHHCLVSTSCSNNAAQNPVLAEVPGTPGAPNSTLLTALTPGTAYELWLTTVDQSGNESAGNATASEITATTSFSGIQSGAQTDFTSAQQAPAVGAGDNGDTVSVWFTWTNSMLYLGIGNTAGTSLLTSNQDVLWVAVDTDPDSDVTGEPRTPSLGNNEVIWPFNANTVVEFIPNGLNSAVVSRPAANPCALIHSPNTNPVSSDCTAIAGAPNFDGASGGVNGLAEVGIPLSALGATPPAKLRFAVAVLNSTNGDAYALAPKNPAAIDVIGYFGSLTSSFNPGANVTNGTNATTSVASSPLSPAASLVTIAALIPVTSPNSGAVKGSLHPLSYTLSDTKAALRDDGTGGDATAGDGIWSGAFNFGGVSQELFFKFDDGAGNDEFTAGSDRVWTLGGVAEALPQLSFNTVYSKNHAFQLTFAVINPQGTTNMKEVVGNVSELGNFTPGMGAVLAVPASGSSTWTTAPVAFMNHDFTSAPLQWKARDNGSDTWESDWVGGPSNNHEMNDDILNKRTLTWTWNDYSHDPY